MATSLTTRETVGGGATVKNAPLTNTEVDTNFISLANNKVEIIDGTVAVIPTGTTGERPATPAAGYLRFNESEGAFEGYNGAEWDSIGGGGVEYTRHTSNYTAEEGEGVLADTSGGAFTVALPASPSIGSTVVISDAEKTWDTNNLTVDRNGNTINGTAGNLQLDSSGVSVTFVYNGSTWRSYTQLSAEAGLDLQDDTTSTATFYPSLSDSTSGKYGTAYVSSTKLNFAPDTGTLNATQFNSLSDIVAKTNISSIDSAMNTINEINPVEFDWKDNGNHSSGVIAQELEKVLPHLVSTSDNGTKSVNYAGLSAYLLSAIQELSLKINK